MESVTSKYIHRTPYEFVLQRPELYVGECCVYNDKPRWVWTADGTVQSKPFECSPALLNICDEIYANAADNRHANPPTTRVDVEISTKCPSNPDIGPWIRIRNNGRGIPNAWHTDCECYVPEMVFGVLHSSSNYNDEEARITGGRNGLGAKLTNMFSHRFEVETADSSRQTVYKQTWTTNMSVRGEPKFTKYRNTKDDYTEVRFVPDLKRLGYSSDTLGSSSLHGVVGWLAKRAFDLAGIHPGLRVVVNGTSVKFRSFLEYASLHRFAAMEHTVAKHIPVPVNDSKKAQAISESTTCSRSTKKTKGDIVVTAPNTLWQSQHARGLFSLVKRVDSSSNDEHDNDKILDQSKFSVAMYSHQWDIVVGLLDYESTLSRVAKRTIPNEKTNDGGGGGGGDDDDDDDDDEKVDDNDGDENKNKDTDKDNDNDNDKTIDGDTVSENQKIVQGHHASIPVNVSFVNGLETIQGGTHVSYVRRRVVQYLLGSLPGNVQKWLTSQRLGRCVCLYINATIPSPRFETQTKETLKMPTSVFTPLEADPQAILGDTRLKRQAKKAITQLAIATKVEKAVEASYNSFLRQAGAQHNTTATTDEPSGGTGGTSRRKLAKITDLTDAIKAGRVGEGKHCTLILTEGKSAQGFAMAGLSQVDKRYFGVFPLRGNFINVRENEHKAMTKNKEVQALVDILGLEYHKAYDTQAKRNRLRYGRVLVMADQDTDGSHIKGLILNFFHYFWPSLLHATHLSPFLWQFITPYIKAIPTSSSSSIQSTGGTVGNHGPNGEIWFYTEPEYNAWKDLQSGKSSKYRIKFYKGLGTSTSAEAKQYFCRYEDHIIPFQYTGQQSDQALELVFGQGREGDRREWIRQHRPDTYVEYKKEGLPIETFVDTEYQLFSVYTVMRSIPMLMDGLKPSHRKILYGSFMRQLGQSVNHECKVAQLGASAANITAYHHGEEGLGKVIIQMAQDFVGRNNVPLFFPSGQFGTRKSGGKDAASPRYTHTYFQPYTRTLFPAQDDGLLFREKEDDKLIEPSWYAPIVPVGLCNGSYGMATGFKTDIPCFHPLEIIEVLQRMLHEHPDLSSSYTTPASTFFDEIKRTHGHLVPWYVGFRGSIVQHQDQRETTTTTTTTTSSAEPSFVVRGSLEIQDPPANDILAEHKDVSSSVSMVLIIRDLPVKQWTQPYREYMEHRSEWKSTIDFFEEMNGEYDIIIHIGLNEKGAEKVRQLQAKDQTYGNDSQGKRSALYTALGLESQIQYRQLYAFNCDGLLCKYQDPYDMMAAFVPTRLWLYEKRRQALLEEHQLSVDKLNNVVSFLEHVINGSIELRGRTKQDLVQELRERQFRPYNAGNNEDGFDYLLRHNLWTLTREHMEKQYEQKQKAEEKYEALRNTTAVQLWQRELSQLHAQINDHIQYRWSLVLDAKGDGIPKFTPKKRSRAKSSTKA